MKEYNEVWQHYRHLENARTKYMNFFFTALFAVFSFFTALIRLDKFETSNQELTLWMILLYIFSAFTLYIFINIVKIGWVLDGYNRIQREIRQLFLDTKTINKISVTNYLPKNSKKIFRLQYSAELFLKICLLVLNFIIIISFISNLCVFSLIQIVLLLLCFLFLLFGETYTILKTKKRKRRKTLALKNRQQE